MQPYNTDIDATLQNNFSCIINSEGGTKVVKYTVEISEFDGNGVIRKHVTLPSPLYNGNLLTIPIDADQLTNGTDYIWNVTIYEENQSMWVAYGVVQSGSTTSKVILRDHFNVETGMYLKIGNQMREIVDYVRDEDDDTATATVSPAFSTAPSTDTEYNVYTDHVKSFDTYFKARKTPEVKIINIPTDVVDNRTYTFTGSYSQEEGVTWKYYQFDLYDSNNNVADTTGRITTGEITYTFDGFLDNSTYSIELIVENQDDTIVTTGRQYFNVDYEEPQLDNIPQIQTICDQDALRISWGQPYINIGVLNCVGGQQPVTYIPNEPYRGGCSVWLRDKCTLEYSPMTSVTPIPFLYESTTCIHVRLSNDFDGTIIELEDSETGDFYRVTYTSGTFTYNINEEYIGTVKIFNFSDDWLLQPILRYNENTEYIWDDEETWDDTEVWCEQVNSVLDKIWWKIYLLPTKIVVSYTEVEYHNIFSPPNMVMEFPTKLYSDYLLKTTDVLYE